MGAEAFAAAKSGLVWINTARGRSSISMLWPRRCVRQGGGCRARRSAQGTRQSATSADRAWTAREDWLRGRLLFTPHAAFYSPAAMQDMQRKAVEVILPYIDEGRLINCVSRESLSPIAASVAQL
jgi:lactate dehydrogenase-like 2-hydroxyacid dehydrogenase